MISELGFAIGFFVLVIASAALGWNLHAYLHGPASVPRCLRSSFIRKI